MPPARRSLFPPFAGVALADILANSVAIVIIMIAVTLMVRYDAEEDKLEQTEDVAVLLSRELASSFVMNALPSSPPAQLHDYVASPLDRNPQHATMPIIELHDAFLRDYYTGATYRRDELLLQDNAFDAYLAGLAPEQLAALRVDIYSIQQFYVAMSIFKAHGLNPRHWHFLAGAGVPGRAGEIVARRTDQRRRDSADAALGEETAAGRGPESPGAALPADVSPALAGSGFGAYPDDLAAAGGGAGTLLEYFNLPGSTADDVDRAPTGIGLGDAGVGSGAPAASSRNVFRSARRSVRSVQIEGDLRADIHAVLHALFAYMRSVQAAVDDNLPSPLPHYDFRRDVLGRMADLPAPDDTEEQLLSSLVFLMRSPRQPQDDALALDHETADGVRGQAVVLFANEPAHRLLWLRDAEQPLLEPPPETATTTLRLGLHAGVYEGLRMTLGRDSLVLMPAAEPDPHPRWRVVTLVNAPRNDFVTGFLYAALDDAGRLILPVDENAVEMDGLRIESFFPGVAYRGEFRQLLFYVLIAVLFAAGIIVRYVGT